MSSSGVAGATSAGMGGASTSGGGSTGASGAAGDAIGSGGSAKDASVDNTGSAGTGGQPPPDAGPGDAKVEGGDVGPLTITVTGTVIDVLRRPYPGVPVAIGNTVTSTDAQGTFRVTGVTPPYDVALSVSTPLTYGWYFVGLTIPSPVLQVETEMGSHKGQTYLTLNMANAPAVFPPPNEFVGYSWGSPDGRFSTHARGNPDVEGPDWYGPATAVGAAHVLAWMMDAASLPTTYVGYDTTHPGTATLSGTVALRTLATPHNDAYVSLPKGAFIKIASEDRDPTKSTFSYNVPTGVTGATLTVCAQAGSWVNWPFSLAHKHGLSPGQAGVALAVPDAATLGIPGIGAVLSTSTDFSWSAPAGQQGPAFYIVSIEFGNSRPYNQVRIVTSKTTARMPKFPAALGPIVIPNVGGEWYVETLGSYGSVDAAATASGFIDPFDYSAGVIGLLDKDGTHSWSAPRSLMTSASP